MRKVGVLRVVVEEDTELPLAVRGTGTLRVAVVPHPEGGVRCREEGSRNPVPSYAVRRDRVSWVSWVEALGEHQFPVVRMG